MSSGRKVFAVGAGAVAGGVALILIIGALAGRGGGAAPATPTPIARQTPAPAPEGAVPATTVAKEPTPVPPTAAPPVTSVATATTAAPARVKVSGVGADGLNVRSEPSANAPRLKTIPEGAELEIAGADRQAEGRTWRNVRDPADGATGWAAADFLAAPGQAAPAPVAPAVKPEPKPAAPAKPSGPAVTGKPSAGVAPASQTTCPSSHPVKGNQGSRSNVEWIYHVPGSPSYAATHPERCFATAAEAAAAGYRAPDR